MIEAQVADGSLAVERADGTEVLRGVGEVLLSDGRVLTTRQRSDGPTWDAARHVLTITPSDTGPAARRVEVFVSDPNGPLRRVPFSVADPMPIQIQLA